LLSGRMVGSRKESRAKWRDLSCPTKLHKRLDGVSVLLPRV
jgi:hypothetical protein